METKQLDTVQFNAVRAEQQGDNILILRRMDNLHPEYFTDREGNKYKTRWELEHRWVSDVRDPHSVFSNEFTYWPASEAKQAVYKGLFNSFNLF